ncbi:MAG: extracellular solute-binding protein [Chloroflexi bacterium]|nr:extracellular solute-binding protein [Chloroflexota bacterium]
MKRLGIAALVLVAVVMVACSSGPAAAPAPAKDASGIQVAPGKFPVLPDRKLALEEIKQTFAKIEEAARKEGRVNHIGGIENQPEITALFNKKYPEIQLNILAGRTAELMARLEAEQASKNYVGDIFGSSNSSTWLAAQYGWSIKSHLERLLPTLNDPSVAWAKQPVADPEGYFVYGSLYNIFGLGINTKLIPSDKQPKKWADLTDPYFKGKLSQDFIDRPGIGSNWVTIMHELPEFGPAYLQKMATQQIKFILEREKLLAQGEFPVALLANGGQLVQLAKDGVPVKFIFPEDGYIYSTRFQSVLTGAPNPNASIVFLEFSLSKEAQLAATKEGRALARGDVPHPAPEIQDIKGRKVLEFRKEWVSTQEKLMESEGKRFGLK